MNIGVIKKGDTSDIHSFNKESNKDTVKNSTIPMDPCCLMLIKKFCQCQLKFQFLTNFVPHHILTQIESQNTFLIFLLLILDAEKFKNIFQTNFN